MVKNIQGTLKALIEQSNMLLDKQIEAKRESIQLFSDFLSLLDSEKREVSDAKDKVIKFATIKEIISKQAKQFDEEISQDIVFLQDQIKALGDIVEEENKEKQTELIEMILDGEEVVDTLKFKKDLEEDSVKAKESFEAVINDLKEALLEGSLDDLLAYLQEITKEEDEDEGVHVELEGVEEIDQAEFRSLGKGCCGKRADSCCEDELGSCSEDDDEDEI